MDIEYSFDRFIQDDHLETKTLELKVHSGLIDQNTLNGLYDSFSYLTKCYNIVVRSIKDYGTKYIEPIYESKEDKNECYPRIMYLLQILRQRIHANASKRKISKYCGEAPKIIYSESIGWVIDTAICKYIGYLKYKHSLPDEYVPDIYSGYITIYPYKSFDELNDCNDMGIQKYFSRLYIINRNTKRSRLEANYNRSTLHIKGLGDLLVYMHDCRNILQYVIENMTSFTIKMNQLHRNGRYWKEFSVVMSYKFSKSEVPGWVSPLYTAPIIISIDTLNVCSIVSPIVSISKDGGSPKPKIVKLNTFDNVVELLTTLYPRHTALIDILVRKGLLYNSIPEKFFREPYDEDETLSVLNNIKRVIHDDIMKMVCEYPVGIIVITIPENKVLDEYFPIYNVMAYKLISRYLKIYCDEHYIRYMICKVKEAEFFECNHCKENGKTWVGNNDDPAKYTVGCRCGMRSPITRNFLYNIKDYVDIELYEKCPPGFVNQIK